MAKVKFNRLSYAAYLLKSTPDPDTIYFILDKPFIFLNGQQYGVTIDKSKHLVNNLFFDDKDGTIKYTVVGDDTPILLSGLGYATSNKGGLMSKEQADQLAKLTSAMKDISDVKDYVDEQISSTMAWNDV